LDKVRRRVLRTGNMERVAWTAIEGRQIKSARGECVLLCGRKDKVGKTSPDERTYGEPRNREMTGRTNYDIRWTCRRCKPKTERDMWSGPVPGHHDGHRDGGRR